MADSPLDPIVIRKAKSIRRKLRSHIKADGMSARSIVLQDMLVIEGITKTMFGPFIGIEKERVDPTKPKKNRKKSIKDGRLPVSFESMLIMLVHLNVLDEDTQWPKLHLLSEIRNQFVHNWKANSFTVCFCKSPQ